MDKKTKQESEKIKVLADEHWAFISPILQMSWEENEHECLIPIHLVEFLYKQAMIHGHKHANN